MPVDGGLASNIRGAFVSFIESIEQESLRHVASA